MQDFHNEMVDRFGLLPEEFLNLLNMVNIKRNCIALNIQNLDAGPNGFGVIFNEHSDVSEMVLKFLTRYPVQVQIKPNNKLVFLKKLTPKNSFSETESLLAKLKESQG